MKRILILILAVAFSLVACTPKTGLEIREPWARPAAQGENSAVYFMIQNHSSQTHDMVGAASDIAQAVEIHESMMSGDVKQIHQLHAVSVEPDTEVKLRPGGLHIMLIGLKKELKVGDEFEITLHFTNFEDINVTVPVSDMPVSGEDSAPDH